MKTFIISILLMYLGLSTYGQSIIGTWQVSTEETFKKMKQSQIDKIRGDLSFETFKKTLGSTKLAFYPNQDMALEVTSPDGKIMVEKGKWKFSADEKQIVMFRSDFGLGDTLNVRKLTKRKLILVERNNNSTLDELGVVLFPTSSKIDTSKANGFEIYEEDVEQTDINPAVSKEVLADIIKSVPSPIEISFLIKDLGIEYDKNLQAEIKNSSINDFQNAWNLGVYSSSLGYAHIYEQQQDAIKYLNSIKEMADGLKVGDFFDSQTIQKLMGKNNLDSLLMVTTTNLENINGRLQKKGRADLTIIILTGGWLEALYLSCEVAKKSPNILLYNRIGEQGIILDQLLLLLSFYEEEVPNIKNLIDDLHNLKQIYDDNVKIEYTYTDTTLEEDNISSEITFTNEDLDAILQVTTKIRNKMLK